MAKNVVPVFSRNATSSKEKPLYYLSQAEALALIDSGKAKRVSKRKAPLMLQMLQLVTPESRSQCGITFRESRANAGIDGSAGYIKRVREKVTNWMAPDVVLASVPIGQRG